MNLSNKTCSHYLNLDFSNGFLNDAEHHLFIGLPYPIHKPFKGPEEDVVAKYDQDVKIYNKKLAHLCKDFNTVKHDIMKQSFQESHAIITKELLDFCTLEKIELPYPCDYNPYYTTGCLQCITLNGDLFLVRPDSKNQLRVTRTTKLRKSKRLQIDRLLSPVFGISSIGCETGDQYLLLQHPNEVNLLRIADLDECAQIMWTKKFKRKILSTRSDRVKLGVILSDLKIRFFDLDTEKRVNLVEESGPVINLDIKDEHSVAVMGHSSLTIFDDRSEEKSILKPTLDECNLFCSFKIIDNTIYVATRHHLIRSDLRFLRNSEFCTHLMRNPPCYMEILKTDHNSMLCLSSQKHDERVVFHGFSAGSLPLDVPAITETLRRCRLSKDVLLMNHLDLRLSKSVIGLKILPVHGTHDVHLYTANSFGEVFKQNITNNEPRICSEVDCLYDWIMKLPERRKPLRLTNVENLSAIRFSLNSDVDEATLNKLFRRNDKVKSFHKKFGYLYRTSNLAELAANFASIWDDEEESMEEQADVDLVPEVAPLDKVSNWIESSYFLE